MKLLIACVATLAGLGFAPPGVAHPAPHAPRHGLAAQPAPGACLVPASAAVWRTLPPGFDGARRSAAYQSVVFEGTDVRLSVGVQNTSTLTQVVAVAFAMADRTTVVTETLAPSTIATVLMPESAAQPTDGLVDWARPAPGGVLHAAITIDACAMAQELEIPVLPRPVVLVHGFEGSAHDWDAYLAYLQERHVTGSAVGLDMGPAQPWPLRRTNTIAQNAVLLRDQMRDFQERTGAASVDVIAHSMGGLVARFYIQQLMPTWGDGQRAVRQLVMLGTPNGGSPFAVTYARLGRSRPAADELTPGALSAFNRVITDTKSVAFRMIAGDAQPRGLLPGGDDCRVTVDSALALPLDPASVQIVKRTNSCVGTTLHTLLRTDRTIFEQNVLPFLRSAAR